MRQQGKVKVTDLQSIARSMRNYREHKRFVVSPIIQAIASGAQPSGMNAIVIDTFNEWLEMEDPMLPIQSLSTKKHIADYRIHLHKFITDLRTFGKIDDFWAFQISNILNVEYLPRKNSIWSWKSLMNWF